MSSSSKLLFLYVGLPDLMEMSISLIRHPQ